LRKKSRIPLLLACDPPLLRFVRSELRCNKALQDALDSGKELLVYGRNQPAVLLTNARWGEFQAGCPTSGAMNAFRTAVQGLESEPGAIADLSALMRTGRSCPDCVRIYAECGQNLDLAKRRLME
jgi:hypothetical protein